MKILLKNGRFISSLSRKGFVRKIKSALKTVVDFILNLTISMGDWATQKLEFRNAWISIEENDYQDERTQV